MRIALVHELLTMKGGAERVFKILTEMFPDAPIYTLLYDEKKLGDWFPPERVQTSTLQKFARFSTNHHYYLPWFPQAVEAWNFGPCSSPHPDPLPFKGEREEKFDLVISSSSAFAHGIITNGNPRHLCYVHSPARYLWDRTHEVINGPTYAKASAGKFAPLRKLRKFALSYLFHRLRIWDAESADRPDMLLASSKEVQRRIELYWRRGSTVVYPPIDDEWFQDSPCHAEVRAERASKHHQKNYFLIVSTLVPYKRIEIAIDACNKLKLPLKIIGEGPHRKTLERMAGPTIEFLGFKNHDELKDWYTHALATIFPGDEDFGLVPLESFARGTPVIAYRKGGALETIVEGKTGMFFDDTTPLSDVLQSFDASSFDPHILQTQAQKFSRSRFEDSIRKAINAMECSSTPSP